MNGRDISSAAKKIRLQEDIDWYESEAEDFSAEEYEEEDESEKEIRQSESEYESESETAGVEGGSHDGFQRGADLKPKEFHFDDSLAGVRSRIPGQISIFGYLKLFITSAIMNIIVNETNRYGLQKHGDAWQLVDEKDIWRIFGLILLMGIVKKPTLSSYWSTDPLLSTPVFSKMISRNRFLMVLSSLHFTDNSENPAGNKLFKLGSVFAMICDRLSSVLLPGKFISIDESLLAWKGRLSFRQYIPSKRSRFGIKLFALCDAVSGYVHKLSVYIGDEQEQAEGTGRGVTHNIVMKLMSGLLNLGHCLFMDNFYNSPELAAELVKNNTHVCGTLRPNRKGVPKDLKMYNGKLIKKDTGKVNYKGDKVCKPAVVLDYNKYMGGVDKSDQNLHYYIAARKTMKWYKKL
ncbi:piggyBac transposable element-derived protein 4-like, partial [Watersipora subatra]|uniref:piggyBac transposable element-derived protein 4-like n=1 Tax=Watersipora subatra TaxID=2589382 RepID=UPI00355BFBDA